MDNRVQRVESGVEISCWDKLHHSLTIVWQTVTDDSHRHNKTVKQQQHVYSREQTIFCSRNLKNSLVSIPPHGIKSE